MLRLHLERDLFAYSGFIFWNDTCTSTSQS
jgi:hypothetical protein